MATEGEPTEQHPASPPVRVQPEVAMGQPFGGGINRPELPPPRGASDHPWCLLERELDAPQIRMVARLLYGQIFGRPDGRIWPPLHELAAARHENVRDLPAELWVDTVARMWDLNPGMLRRWLDAASRDIACEWEAALKENPEEARYMKNELQWAEGVVQNGLNEPWWRHEWLAQKRMLPPIPIPHGIQGNTIVG